MTGHDPNNLSISMYYLMSDISGVFTTYYKDLRLNGRHTCI